MYGSLEGLKRYLGITRQTDDVLLEEMLERATAAVEAWTGKRFTTTEEMRQFPVWLATGMFLEVDFFVTLSEVVLDGTDITEDVEVVPPRAPHRGLMYRWPRRGTAEVTAAWGYASEPPADVVQATIRWAAYMYAQKDSGSFETQAMPELGVVRVPAGIPADVRALLARYRGEGRFV